MGVVYAFFLLFKRIYMSATMEFTEGLLLSRILQHCGVLKGRRRGVGWGGEMLGVYMALRALVSETWWGQIVGGLAEGRLQEGV